MKTITEELKNNWKYAHPVLKIAYTIEDWIENIGLNLKRYVNFLTEILLHKQIHKGGV
ncbi:MAG: hypothetical protein ACD_50C00113G0002 [uncultured bacterium]|nr:MAG: hypothetical protein ACD_50C00113G0002 [uncultured bacterium]